MIQQTNYNVSLLKRNFSETRKYAHKNERF